MDLRFRMIFVDWLEEQITTNEKLIEQMKKHGIMPELITRYQAETEACRVVLRLLAVEEITL